MIDELVRRIQDSPVDDWILSSPWLWPSLEILHFIGLSLLLGAILVVDLRLAGFLRGIDLAAAKRFLPWSVVGFALNLVSGSLFFLGDPGRYAINVGFQVKMLLVAIAGLNALYFLVRLAPRMEAWASGGETPVEARAIAWISLVAWFGVLLLGRLIPYIGTG